MKRSIYEHFICFTHVFISLLNTIVAIKLTNTQSKHTLNKVTSESYDNHSGLLDPLGINVVW